MRKLTEVNVSVKLLQRDRTNKNNSGPKARELKVKEKPMPQLKDHEAGRIFSYLG